MTGPVSSNCVRTGRTRCCCMARPASANCKFAQHLAQGLLCEAPQAERRAVRPVRRVPVVQPGQSPGLPRGRARGAGRPRRGHRTRAAPTKKPTPTKARKRACPARKSRSNRCGRCSISAASGSHRGGLRVVLLYPAEALNVAAANALLKTLEEPPSGVVFLMVSARVDRLLPTIISRCRQWPMIAPAACQRRLRGWKRKASAIRPRCSPKPAARRSPRWRSPPTKTAPLRDFTLAQLAAGPNCDAFACGENLQKLPVPTGARLAAALALRPARATHGGSSALLSERVEGAGTLRAPGRCRRVRPLS